MLAFNFSEDSDTVFATLFRNSENGHLNFGLTGKSIDPTSFSEINSNFINFRDYVMEGFVSYSLRLFDAEHGARLEVKVPESPRAKYVEPTIKQYFKDFEISPHSR